jgi:hypothetical protein
MCIQVVNQVPMLKMINLFQLHMAMELKQRK